MVTLLLFITNEDVILDLFALELGLHFHDDAA